MINSDFDRIIRGDNNYNNNNTKKGKLKIFIIIFLIILLIAGGIVGYIFYLRYKTAMPRMKFAEYVQATNIKEITDTSILEGIYEKMGQSSYTLTNNISMVSDQKDNIMSRLNFDINYYKDNEKKSNKFDLILKDNQEKIFESSAIFDSENIAIKSEEIVVKYVGSKIKNIPDVISKLYGVQVTEETENSSNNNKIEIPNPDIFEKYKMVISSKFTDEQFSMEKNVKLTQNNTSVDTTLYKLTFSKEEIIQILTELQDILINDDELIGYLINKNTDTQEDYEMGGISPDNIFNLMYGNKINVDPEEIKEEIENNYTAIYQELNKIENLNFEFEIYVSNSKVIKEVISLGDLLEINIDILEKDKNENSIKATILLTNQENQEKNGLSISLSRKNNNVTTNIIYEVCLIENMQINNKLILEETLEGNGSSNIVNSNLKIKYSDTQTEHIAQVASKLEYNLKEEVEQLTQDNCLFIDELDNNSLEEIKNAILQKIMEVFEVKMENLLKDDEPNNIPNEIIDMDGKTDAEKKEEAKNKLITAIQGEMQKAQEEERLYTLMDLQGLNIEDTTLSIMVEENLAVIAIDGYTFYIDPNFNLSE